MKPFFQYWIEQTRAFFTFESVLSIVAMCAELPSYVILVRNARWTDTKGEGKGEGKGTPHIAGIALHSGSFFLILYQGRVLILLERYDKGGSARHIADLSVYSFTGVIKLLYIF